MSERVILSTRTTSCACATCGHELSGATSPEGHAPRPGDLSVCAYCGALLVFCDDLTTRAATAAEETDLDAETRATVAKLRAFLAYVRQQERRA